MCRLRRQPLACVMQMYITLAPRTMSFQQGAQQCMWRRRMGNTLQDIKDGIQKTEVLPARLPYAPLPAERDALGLNLRLISDSSLPSVSRARSSKLRKAAS